MIHDIQIERLNLVIFLVASSCLFFLVQQKLTTYDSIDLTLTGLNTSIVKLYYDQDGFSDENSVTLKAGPKLIGTTPAVHARLPVKSGTKTFRMNFESDPEEAFRFQVIGFEYVESGLLATRKVHYDIRSSAFKTYSLELYDNGTIHIPQGARYPSITIDLNKGKRTLIETYYHTNGIALIALLILLSTLLRKSGKRSLTKRYMAYELSYFLLAVVALLLYFATMLPFFHGPDEYLHFFSGSWYLDHIRPPSLGDDQYRHTYWLTNYIIGTTDISYLLTGRLALVISYWSDFPEYLSTRYSQILILFLVFLTAIKLAGPGYSFSALITFFLVPQFWYLHTYYNGDAVSISLGFLALTLIVAPAVKNKLLALAIASAILINLKTNYVILLADAIALYFLVKEINPLQRKKWPAIVQSIQDDLQSKTARIGIGIVIATGSARHLFIVFDQLVSGMSTMDFACQDSEGQACKKLLAAKERGLDWTIPTKQDWYEKTFDSAFAVFGLMKYHFAYVVQVSSLLFGIWMLRAFFRSRWPLIVLFVVTLAANIAASLYYSMSYDYQPQGRYLFPTLVLAAVIAGIAGQRLGFFWKYAPIIGLLALTTFAIDQAA